MSVAAPSHHPSGGRCAPRGSRTWVARLCLLLALASCIAAERPDTGLTVELRHPGPKSTAMVGLKSVDHLPSPSIGTEMLRSLLGLGGNARCERGHDPCYVFVRLAPGAHTVTVSYAIVVGWQKTAAELRLPFDAADHGTYWLEAAVGDEALHIWLRDDATGRHVTEATVVFPSPPPRTKGSGLRREG